MNIHNAINSRRYRSIISSSRINANHHSLINYWTYSFFDFEPFFTTRFIPCERSPTIQLRIPARNTHVPHYDCDDHFARTALHHLLVWRIRSGRMQHTKHCMLEHNAYESYFFYSPCWTWFLCTIVCVCVFDCAGESIRNAFPVPFRFVCVFHLCSPTGKRHSLNTIEWMHCHCNVNAVVTE